MQLITPVVDRGGPSRVARDRTALSRSLLRSPTSMTKVVTVLQFTLEVVTVSCIVNVRQKQADGSICDVKLGRKLLILLSWGSYVLKKGDEQVLHQRKSHMLLVY